MTKRVTNYKLVPNELQGKFPNIWVLLLEKSTRIACEVAMLLVSFCALYATLLGPPYRSEWLYLIAAGLGPVAVAAWYVAFPFNPYRSVAATREGMKDLDISDKDANTLVAFLRSLQARQFLLRTAWKLSLLFVVPMAVIFGLMRQMPIWRFGVDSLVRIPIFLFVCLFVLFRVELLNWALESWKATEESNQAIQ